MSKVSSNNRIGHHLEVQPSPPEAKSALPTIDLVQPAEEITVGAGGMLVVPREDFDAAIVEGSELDLVGMAALKIRKPDRREWICLNLSSELPTRMLLHKPKADGIDVEHYFVASNLRGPIRDELKNVRVFVYYSVTTRTYGLWVVNVTIDNSWYESLVGLFRQPAKFFDEQEIRLISDKGNSRYRVKYRPRQMAAAWPNKPTSQLLGDALGASRFITTSDHPLYLDLTEGRELD